MDTNALADMKVNELTKTRSAGRPINIHVARCQLPDRPDFELMRRAVHAPPRTPEPEKEPVA
jgi:hypothetical protein